MNVQYHTYTAADVKAWLYEGAKNGLSEQVISKVRANAILHNPYLKDEMVIVVSATDGNRVVGFTAMFPEHLVRPDLWLTVPTTLYAHPDYAGEFIGYYVSKVLHDTADGRLVIGTDLAKETILIDKLLGLRVDYITQYVINQTSIKSFPWLPKVANRLYRKSKAKKMKQKTLQFIKKYEYALEYISFIDDETYTFIKMHSEHDLFLRSQNTLNWILQYGFRTEAPLANRFCSANYFNSGMATYRLYGVKVMCNNQLVGFYMLRNSSDGLSVKYLYYLPEYQARVYASITEHLMEFENYLFTTNHKSLAEYISQSCGMYSNVTTRKFAYSHPTDLVYTENLQLQGGDGDMFI